MDECNDSDFDFPILRRKNDNEKVLRVTSLQPNATQKVKQPLARNISTPTRFNYSMKVKVDKNRISDTPSFGSKMSFRGFVRRMSERKRRPTADSDFSRRRGIKSIRFAAFLNYFLFPISNQISAQEYQRGGSDDRGIGGTWRKSGSSHVLHVEVQRGNGRRHEYQWVTPLTVPTINQILIWKNSH